MRKLEVIMQEVRESKAAIDRLKKSIKSEEKTLKRLRLEAQKAVAAQFGGIDVGGKAAQLKEPST